MNILNQLDATNDEKSKMIEHFKNNAISHHAVEEALRDLRLTIDD